MVTAVTTISSQDEILGVSFDGTNGRVSVKNRRIWMIKLALDGTLRRNALSSACLRLVGHLSCAFVAVSMTFHSQAFSRFLTRFLAEMLNCGAVLGVNSGGPPAVYLQCLQI